MNQPTKQQQKHAHTYARTHARTHAHTHTHTHTHARAGTHAHRHSHTHTRKSTPSCMMQVMEGYLLSAHFFPRVAYKCNEIAPDIDFYASRRRRLSILHILYNINNRPGKESCDKLYLNKPEQFLCFINYKVQSFSNEFFHEARNQTLCWVDQSIHPITTQNKGSQSQYCVWPSLASIQARHIHLIEHTRRARTA